MKRNVKPARKKVSKKKAVKKPTKKIQVKRRNVKPVRKKVSKKISGWFKNIHTGAIAKIIATSKSIIFVKYKNNKEKNFRRDYFNKNFVSVNTGIKKIAVKKLPTLSSYHKKGTNRISIVFPTGKKTLEQVESMLLLYDWTPIVKQMKVHKKRNPITKRINWIPPVAFYVIIRLLKPKDNEQYHTTISPVDMVVNIENIQDLTLNTMYNLFESWSASNETIKTNEDLDSEEYKELFYLDKLDMRYLKEIIYHFIYLK